MKKRKTAHPTIIFILIEDTPFKGIKIINSSSNCP